MSRFDFLEIGTSRPRRLPASEPAPAAEALPCIPTPPRWKVAEVIGGPGTAVGEFAAPGGLTVDGSGNLYVADSYNHRIQRISPQGDVFAMGRRGSRPGEFLNPRAVAVAWEETRGESRLCVLEQGNHRIQIFDPGGTLLAVWGCDGSSWESFHSPMGLAVDPAGSLYVADTGNNRIVRWSLSGRPLAVLDGAVGGGPTSWKPQGVCCDRAGVLFVADTLQHQVLLFDARLRPIGRLGAPGDGPGEFSQPQDVAVDAEGHLFVVETGNHRLQVLDRSGRSLQRIEHAGKLGRFQSPAGVAIAPDGSLYLADTGNHRIFRLQREEGTPCR